MSNLILPLKKDFSIQYCLSVAVDIHYAALFCDVMGQGNGFCLTWYVKSFVVRGKVRIQCEMDGSS